MKESFLLFTDNLTVVRKLTDEQAGQLLKAIEKYVSTGIIPEMEQLIEIAFEPIKNSIDRNNKKYADEVEKRREAGRLGGLARARNAKQSQASASDAKQDQANQGDNEPEPVPVPVPELNNYAGKPADDKKKE